MRGYLVTPLTSLPVWPNDATWLVALSWVPLVSHFSLFLLCIVLFLDLMVSTWEPNKSYYIFLLFFSCTFAFFFSSFFFPFLSFFLLFSFFFFFLFFFISLFPFLYFFFFSLFFHFFVFFFFTWIKLGSNRTHQKFFSKYINYY